MKPPNVDGLVNWMSDKTEKFWVRMNNSTRALPEIEIEDYCRDHW